MKILVTGSDGFIGKNLIHTLKHTTNHDVLEINRETSKQAQADYLKQADIIYHLAGVNRPHHNAEFMIGNKELTAKMIEQLESLENYPPIVFSSSIQAELGNQYGKSKRAAEQAIKMYSKKNEVPCYIYRLPNVFGKWSKPNYNSVIATFCYRIARDEEIEIHDRKTELSLVYIDDVLKEFIGILNGKTFKENIYYSIPIIYKEDLGWIAALIYSFKESRKTKVLPNLSDSFTKKLYSTYLSYLPEDAFSYPLITHEDARGSFTEFLKSSEAGQVSINVSKAGVTKGEHWHQTKAEKFLVVKGKGLIKLRAIYSDEVIEYEVSDEKLEVVDIPVGYTHSITNTGDEDMVTVMWVNEIYDPTTSDTYPLEV